MKNGAFGRLTSTLTYKTQKNERDTLEVIPGFVWRGLRSLLTYTDFEEEMGLKWEHVGLIMAQRWVQLGPFWAELRHNKAQKKLKEAALSLVEHESKSNLMKRPLIYVKGTWPV